MNCMLYQISSLLPPLTFLFVHPLRRARARFIPQAEQLVSALVRSLAGASSDEWPKRVPSVLDNS